MILTGMPMPAKVANVTCRLLLFHKLEENASFKAEYLAGRPHKPYKKLDSYYVVNRQKRRGGLVEVDWGISRDIST